MALSVVDQILNHKNTGDCGMTLEDEEVAAIAEEIERLRGFIARRYPGFDVDEAIALHDVKPNTD